MTTTANPDSGRELARIMKVVGGVGALLTALALVTYGAYAGFSVAIGAVIAVSNLWVLGKIIASVLPPVNPDPSTQGNGSERSPRTKANANANADADANTDAKANADENANADANAIDAHAVADSGGGGRRAAWTAFAFIKILVLFGGVWALMARGIVSPLGLAVGYGSLFIGIGLSTMLSSMRVR